MFKSRSGSQGHTPTPAAPSIDALRRRARHRLIGAAVLVIAGVVGFPLLFDTAPRPLTADVPIDIPARHAPTLPRVSAPVAVSTESGASSQVPAEQALDARESVESSAPPVAAPPPAPVAPPPAPAPVAPSKPPVAAAPLPPPKPAESSRPSAAAKQSPAQADSAERIIVQVGAFAEAQRAREVRLRLERAGLKTYTHVAETSEGKRIRVRLGPFSSRAEAEKAAAKAKALGLQAAILTL